MRNEPPPSSRARVRSWLLPALALAVAIAALVVAITGRARPRDTPRELVLRDPAGRERIRLVASNSGGMIELLDDRGHLRAALREDGDGVHLRLHPAAGAAEAARLSFHDRTGPEISLHNHGSGVRVDLGATDLGGSGGGLTVAGPTYALSLVASPISTGLLLSSDQLSATLQVVKGTAKLDLGDDLSLHHSSSGSTLDLGFDTARRNAVPRVRLSATQYGGSVRVNDQVVHGPKE
jgi:hypothetical protein